MKQIIKIKKLIPSAIIPKRAKPGDAGMDMTVTSIQHKSWFRIEYGFGIAIEVPEGTFIDIRSRSSIWKTRMLLSNGCGVGDSGYRGEYKAIFWKLPFISKPYKVGERAAQMVIQKYIVADFQEVENLSKTERGAGGYGHTGNK